MSVSNCASCSGVNRSETVEGSAAHFGTTDLVARGKRPCRGFARREAFASARVSAIVISRSRRDERDAFPIHAASVSGVATFATSRAFVQGSAPVPTASFSFGNDSIASARRMNCDVLLAEKPSSDVA